jgi:addiction module HigA family antidote
MKMHSPAHPGSILRDIIDGIAEETGKTLTIGEVATGLGITRQTLSAILNGKASVTPAMAMRLEAAFTSTTAELWLKLQQNYDLTVERKKHHSSPIRVFWPSPDTPSATI